jgi:hypothetical protein
MHVYLDDSGDGGMKLDGRSSPFLVMAACIFTEPADMEKAAGAIANLKRRLGRSERWEFKYSKSANAVKDDFFEIVPSMNFVLRAITLDKGQMSAERRFRNAEELKLFTIEQLLMSNDAIKAAKLTIDGRDRVLFGQSSSTILRKAVNGTRPGTIRKIAFADSERNLLVQLADMSAGAINRSRNLKSDLSAAHLRVLRAKAIPPLGGLFDYPGKDFDPST